jgi:hypothetical protein
MAGNQGDFLYRIRRLLESSAVVRPSRLWYDADEKAHSELDEYAQ